MPLYFKELEKAFIKWYNINNIKKPTDGPASWVTYKSMRKFAKKDLLKSVLKLLKNIESYDIIVIPDLDSKGNYYIKVEPKKIQSKL
jgi:hypothetical protein